MRSYQWMERLKGWPTLFKPKPTIGSMILKERTQQTIICECTHEKEYSPM